MKKVKSIPIGTRVPPQTYRKICEHRLGSKYLNISDYLRDLIRNDLQDIRK